MGKTSGVARVLVVLTVAAATMVAPGFSPATGQDVGFSWPTTLDSFNLAYPDTSADYWMTHFGSVPA